MHIRTDPQKADHPEVFHYDAFNAELGYYDLKGTIGYPASHAVLAWEMTFAGNSNQHPVAYIRADSSTVIYYFNGIYTE